MHAAVFCNEGSRYGQLRQSPYSQQYSWRQDIKRMEGLCWAAFTKLNLSCRNDDGYIVTISFPH